MIYEIEKILGIYKAKVSDGEKAIFSNEFELNIYQANNEILFTFIMKTKGAFGVIGKNWYGKGVFRSDHFALVIENEKDWTYTKSDNKTVEYLRKKHETLKIEIYTDENKAIVYHVSFDNYLTLEKVL
jgi:hypothetical protein